jgi:hypothetical protein
MTKRLIQFAFSVVLISSLHLLADNTAQAEGHNWNYTDNYPQVRWMSDEELRGYREGLMKGAESARVNSKAEPEEFNQYRNGSSAYKYGFRRGFHETRFGNRKASLEGYTTIRWFRR